MQRQCNMQGSCQCFARSRARPCVNLIPRTMSPSSVCDHTSTKSLLHRVWICVRVFLRLHMFLICHESCISVLYFRFIAFCFFAFTVRLANTRHRKVIPMQYATDTICNGADKEYILMVIQAPQVKAPIKEVKKDPT